MDIASFIATVVDPSLRREVFANMNEAQVAALPPNLMAEARRVHEHIRAERQRREQRDPAELQDRAHAMLEQMRRMGEGLEQFRHRGGEREREFLRGAVRYARNRPQDVFGGDAAFNGRQHSEFGRESIEVAVTEWHSIMLEENCQAFMEELLQALAHQLSADEKIIEQLLLVLMTSQSIECSLLPCIMNLVKVLAVGQPVIRNKVMNAITFLLKAFSRHEDEALRAIYSEQSHKINQKRAALLLIGCLRLLLRSNKALMKWMLKGLF